MKYNLLLRRLKRRSETILSFYLESLHSCVFYRNVRTMLAQWLMTLFAWIHEVTVNTPRWIVWVSLKTIYVCNTFTVTVYPKKYAHGVCFAVLCCGYTLTDFPISIRLTSLALWQYNDCPSASKATLMNMDKYFMWIHYERLHNHNKAKHNRVHISWDILYDNCHTDSILAWEKKRDLWHIYASLEKWELFFKTYICDIYSQDSNVGWRLSKPISVLSFNFMTVIITTPVYFCLNINFILCDMTLCHEKNSCIQHEQAVECVWRCFSGAMKLMWRHCNEILMPPSLAQITTCRLIVAKQLPDWMLTDCHFDP